MSIPLNSKGYRIAGWYFRRLGFEDGEQYRQLMHEATFRPSWVPADYNLALTTGTAAASRHHGQQAQHSRQSHIFIRT